MTKPLTRFELLTRLRRERTKLEALLAQLSDAQMTRRGVPDHYSVSDIVAHIAVWDRRGTRWIKATARGETPHIPQRGLTWADVDRLNAETRRANKSRSPRLVIAESRRAFTRLMKVVETLDEKDLKRVVHPIGLDNRYALWQIVAWRYKHMRAHGRHIRKWLSR